ncbi:MAG: NAD(P)-dependent oxidoreductase [Chloroflexi bacterium]|nr:NAD(P)-dependent oxidoreductase [Chloroflexota bacterium]
MDDQRYSGVRAIVLGASGFIGRWVAHALSAQDAKTFLVVRDRASAEKIFSQYNARGEIIETDLANSDVLGELVQRIRPSITFNLAGYGVDPSERDEAIADQINTRLLDPLCLAVANSRDPGWSGQDIVHVGSAQEYGAIRGNLAEDSIPHPTTLYGKTKLAGTNLLSACCRQRGLKGVTTRLFTIYGPGEHTGRLLPSLIETASTGNHLPLTDGNQARDFTYVEDIAQGLLRLGLAPAKTSSVVNLATGKLTLVREFIRIANQVLEISEDRLGFDMLPKRTDEMEHSAVSIERLKQWLDWIPSTSILEGVTRTVAFVQRARLGSM